MTYFGILVLLADIIALAIWGRVDDGFSTDEQLITSLSISAIAVLLAADLWRLHKRREP